jgi:hypothetical protein
MGKILSLFYFFVGLLGAGCFAFNAVRAIGHANIIFVVLFGILAMLSLGICRLAVNEIKKED